MPYIIRSIKKMWDQAHGAMLDKQKARLGFPGPRDVLRNYNSLTSFFRVRHVFELAAPQAGERILIIGDAGGKDYWYFKWRGFEPTIMDITEQSVIGEVVIHDISDPELAFPPGTFDLIVMCDVLEHIYEDSRALANIGTMLKDRGRFILSGPYWHDVTEYHVRIHSPRIVRRMLRHHGFEVQSMLSRGLIMNLYRKFHPLFLLAFVAGNKIAGWDGMIELNAAISDRIKGFQSLSFVPYLDRLLFGMGGGLNGYIAAARKGEAGRTDVAAMNREYFKDAGFRRNN